MKRVRDVIRVASWDVEGWKSPHQRRLDIIALHASRNGYTLGDLLGAKADKRISRVRWRAMADIKLKFDDSYAELGRLFNRHHTSVMHAFRRMAADPDTH